MTQKITSHALEEMIRNRIDARWDAWAQAHPHLAQAIDRTRLIESTASKLRDDPAFHDAMRQADLDEHKLAAAAKVLGHAERLVGRLLSM